MHYYSLCSISSEARPVPDGVLDMGELSSLEIAKFSFQFRLGNR